MKNDLFSSYSSSSSSSSQLSTPSPRAFQNGFLQNLVVPRLSSQTIDESPRWDVEKPNGWSMPKSNEELKKEITELETQILQLEQHLLSLYRTSFEDQLPKLLSDNSPSSTIFHNVRVSNLSSSFESLPKTNKMTRSESSHPSLADLLGLNTASKLSEEMVKLICVILFRLSDKRRSRLIKKSVREDMNEECGVVIHKLCLGENNLNSVESMIHKFKSLVRKLKEVEPAKMTREEKLAFWVNIHNALVIHAYIAYGMCEGPTSTMILKATFDIGGEKVNAHDIQSSILGIRASHSGSHLRALFTPARSGKTSSGGHTYALDYAEPLVHFVLSTGTSNDPMVRVYTAERIFQELRQAREGFIRESVVLEKATRIVLPNIIHNYAKDGSLDKAELFNIISECLTATKRETMRRVVKKKQEKGIRWIHQDSTFRYIIDCDLVKESDRSS